ncbi:MULTISPECIES: type II CRISPR-associated endonuclease Cas1 [Treponema]|uniref:type II CRISPR-associated endonuclease Cas1 n=1 Tax=Treponema TaxID=157 RepID=UPI0020A51032|nr:MULTISPECIES: type II CRISPR-associated endonuclease Cas1 [Treponema]UTC43578.1 type II CRISPR-associated endonuclease Cas1 [Treponema sp. OMZ 857]UTC46888.1 type II CRISPR-associated endonuclease Cas1 [Treponema vincentii]UTC49273.1 type II CRISPR-associated endonuclease Cas1 [Treponema vincentii]
MIKRTLFFSHAVCLSVKHKQLVIFSKETQEETLVPIEDIGFVIVENERVSLTIPLINELTENNCALIFCNEKHMPFSMTMPLDCNEIQSQLFSAQINAKLPVKKKCWKQVVEYKIKNQGLLLKKYDLDFARLADFSKRVKSGDSTNMESQAAKFYWDNLFGKNWCRNRFGEFPNNYLNYGYAILRAATARALAGSGLLPALGIHHHNKYNAYCLADDLMEPYRPFIDDEVIEYISTNPDEKELGLEFKKKILKVLTRDVKMNNLTRPMMAALSMTSASLADALSNESEKLKLPDFV